MCSTIYPGFQRAFEKVIQPCSGEQVDEEVIFGLRNPQAEWLAKLSMRWTTQSGRRMAYLVALDDNWIILPQFRAVYARLASLSGQLITPERFMVILAEKGFKDCTNYTNYVAVPTKPGIDQLYEELERLLTDIRRRLGRST